MEYLTQFKELLPVTINHIGDVILHNEDGQDVWLLVRNVLNLIKPLCLESRQYYLQIGHDGMNRYNSEVLGFFKKQIDSLNNLISENHPSYTKALDRFKEKPDKDYAILLFKKNYNAIEYSILLNRMFFFLDSRFTPDDEKKHKAAVSELSQRQKAIVLYFKEKAGVIPYQERKGLKEQENGSFALYNALCQVRNGNYKKDDLEAAIEFLIEFPTAHKLAIDAFLKS